MFSEKPNQDCLFSSTSIFLVKHLLLLLSFSVASLPSSEAQFSPRLDDELSDISKK